MADFTLSARVVVTADKATDNMEKLKKETRETATQSTFAINRMKQSFMALGVVVGGAFAGIVAWSPSLATAFSLIQLHAGLAAMAIGESLAPVINDTLLPAMEALSIAIIALPEPTQQAIGMFLMMSTVIVAAKLAMIAFSAASIAAVLPFIVVAGLLAVAFVLISENIWGLGDTAREVFAGLGPSIDLLLEALEPVLPVLEAMAYVIGFVLLVAIEAVIRVFGTFIEHTILGLTDIVNMIVHIVEAFADLFSGDYTGFWENLLHVVGDLLNVFIDIFNFFIEGFEDMINSIIHGLNKIPGVNIGDVDFRGIERFHEGRTAGDPGEGLMMLKARETVRTESQETLLQSNLRGGGGGGDTYHYTITIQGGVYTSPASRRQEARFYFEELKREQQRYGRG